MSKIAPYRALQQNIVSRKARVTFDSAGLDLHKEKSSCRSETQPCRLILFEIIFAVFRSGLKGWLF